MTLYPDQDLDSNLNWITIQDPDLKFKWKKNYLVLPFEEKKFGQSILLLREKNVTVRTFELGCHANL